MFNSIEIYEMLKQTTNPMDTKRQKVLITFGFMYKKNFAMNKKNYKDCNECAGTNNEMNNRNVN